MNVSTPATYQDYVEALRILRRAMKYLEEHGRFKMLFGCELDERTVLFAAMRDVVDAAEGSLRKYE